MGECDGIFPGAPCGAAFWHGPHAVGEPAVARPVRQPERLDALRQAFDRLASLVPGVEPYRVLDDGPCWCDTQERPPFHPGWQHSLLCKAYRNDHAAIATLRAALSESPVSAPEPTPDDELPEYADDEYNGRIPR